ncbi:MAG: Ig-like domain-containing protein [Pirellulaceae bacterium]
MRYSPCLPTLRRRPVLEELECRRLLALNPTAAEQEFLQLVNRFRVDPVGEYARLISVASPITARNPIFQAELDFFSVNGNTLRSEMLSLRPASPLAWDDGIQRFTASHNAAMINSNPPQQFHSDGVARRQQLIANGVNLRLANGELVTSENVYGFAKSALHLFAGYVIDWGNGPGGMQTGRPHRVSLGNDTFEHFGGTITSFGGANFGPLVNTNVLANIENPPVMAVGAVFEDENNSGWYEAGEGIGGVNIVFSGAAGTFTTTALSAGGYQIELPAGTYTATATGGGMAHPVVLNNIVVSNKNVWKNLIYDPDAIPADGSEPNNSTGAATELTGRDQTLGNRSIHLPNDVDYFRLQPASTGSASFRIQFSHAAGNLDMQLLNASGAVIATSNSTTNDESITAQVTRGATYFVRVYSVGGAVNGSYSLTVDTPEPVAPVGVSDRATVSSAAPTTTLNILANDTDPDGDRTQLVPKLAANAPAAFSLNSQNRVVYTAPAGFSGMHRTTYTVTDDQGLVSPATLIEIFVVNFAAANPWQNPGRATDVNDDGIISGIDVLLIVNELNANGPRELPRTGNISQLFGFLDVSGSGSFVSGQDALLVINTINGVGSGEGESSLPVEWNHHDLQDEALRQLLAAEAFTQFDRLRKKTSA